MKDGETSLEQFGLSLEESKIYLELVKLGPSAVYDIAHRIGISRSTAYYHLESLIEKGMVSLSFTGKKNIYTPAKPRVLENVMKNKELELEKQKKKMPKLLQQIENLQKAGFTDPEAKISKGRNGIIEVMNDVLSSREDIYFIGSHDIVLENEKLIDTNFFLRNFTAKRRQKGGTKAYIVSDFSKLTLRQMKEEDIDFRQIRIWPELNGVKGGLIVYGSKMSIFSVSDSATIYTIDNHIVSELMKIMLTELIK